MEVVVGLDRSLNRFAPIHLLILVGILLMGTDRSLALEDLASQSLVRIGSLPSDKHYQYQVLESFWELRLFELAHEHCEVQRKHYRPGTDPYALWTIWAIEGHYRQLAELPDPDAEVRRVVEQIAENFLRDTTNQKRFSWVRFEEIRGHWWIGRSKVAVYLSAPANEEVRNQALVEIRSAIDELDSLKAEVAQQIEEVAGQAGSSRQNELREWQVLWNEIVLLEIESFALRAQCYPAGSTDRLAAASQMTQFIEEAHLRIGSNQEVRVKLEVMRITALELSDRFGPSLEAAERLWPELSQDGLKARLVSSAVHSAMAVDRQDLAVEWLNRAGDWKRHPELGLANLERMLGKLQGMKSDNPNLDGELIRCIALKDEMGKLFGPYWLRRAEALVLQRIGKSPASNRSAEASSIPSQIYRTQAQQFLAAGKWREAISELKVAQLLLHQAERHPESLQFGLEAGAIAMKQGDLLEAANLFLESAVANRTADKSADVHWMGCWALAKWLAEKAAHSSESSDSVPHVASKYEEALKRQLENWPSASPTRSARLELDQIFLDRSELELAVMVWRDSLPWIVNDPEALAYLVTRTFLMTVPYRSYQDAKVVDANWIELEKQLDRTTRKPDDSSLAWSESDRERIRWTLKLASRLTVDRRWPDEAGESLEFSSTIASDDEWTNLCIQLVKLLSQLEKTGGQLPRDRLPELLRVLDHSQVFRQLAWSIDFATQESLAEKTNSERTEWLPLVNGLGGISSPMKSAGRIGEVITWQSESMKLQRSCWQGDREGAIRGFEALRQAQPKNVGLLFRLASVYREPNGISIDKSIEIYRRLANGSTSGGPIWLEARWRTAMLLKEQGKVLESQKLAELVLATYPKLAEPWRRRFENLSEPGR